MSERDQLPHPEPSRRPSEAKPGTNEHHAHACDGQLGALHAAARALVESMPGPLQRVVMRSGDLAVEIEWPKHEEVRTWYAPNGDTPASSSQSGQNGRVADPAPYAPVPQAADGPDTFAEETHLVLAPLVGTCYLAPEPGADPFVTVGQMVEAGQPVAIVEAMKLMNEVTAEVGGRVEEILADNAAPVEFAQPLVRISVDVDGAA